MVSVSLGDLGISVLILISSFLLYKVYNISIRLTRIEERVDWLVKLAMSYDPPEKSLKRKEIK